jgi:hypothetical protein
MTTTAAKTRKRNARKHNVKLVIGGAVAILAVLGIQSTFNSPHATTNTAAQSVIVPEDSPAFDCTTMGDHECWPGNSNGVPPGIYDKGGVMVESWDVFVQRVKAADAQFHGKH